MFPQTKLLYCQHGLLTLLIFMMYIIIEEFILKLHIIHALFLFQESCKCSCLLAKTIPDQFYYQAESLVKPLLLSIAHQHSKVRLAVLEVGCNFTAIYVGCCVDVLFKTWAAVFYQLWRYEAKPSVFRSDKTHTGNVLNCFKNDRFSTYKFIGEVIFKKYVV